MTSYGSPPKEVIKLGGIKCLALSGTRKVLSQQGLTGTMGSDRVRSQMVYGL